jgi:hypothetical protein
MSPGKSRGGGEMNRSKQGKTDSAQRAEKKISERLRRLKDPDRIEY